MLLKTQRGMGKPQSNSMPILEHVLRGIKRVHAKKAKPSLICLPITPNILLKIRAIGEEDAKSFDNIMYWAVCCSCCFGFLRSGEICVPSPNKYDPTAHLSITDIAVDSHDKPSIISLKIKVSKTNPFRKRVMVFLGHTGSTLCPVKALLAYISVRGQAPGPLFSFKK